MYFLSYVNQLQCLVILQCEDAQSLVTSGCAVILRRLRTSLIIHSAACPHVRSYISRSSFHSPVTHTELRTKLGAQLDMKYEN